MKNRISKLLATSATATILSLSAPFVIAAPAQVPLGVFTAFGQVSLADANTMLTDALAALEQAKANGGDIDAAQAQVDAANAAIEEANQAAANQAAADAEAQKQADAEAAKAAEAQAAADKAAADQANADAKAAEDAAAAQAAAEAEAAAKADTDAEAQKQADAEAAKAAEAQAAADKAAANQATADAKAAEDAAAAQAAADAEAAAKADTDAEAAADAKAAADAAKAVEPTPAIDPTPPLDSAPAVDTPPEAAVDSAPAAAGDPQAAPSVDSVPAPSVDPTPAPAVDSVPAAAGDPQAAPLVDSAPAPTVDPTPAPAVDPVTAPTVDPILEKLPDPLPDNAAPAFDSAKEIPANDGDLPAGPTAEELKAQADAAAAANAAAEAEAQKQADAQKVVDAAVAAKAVADAETQKLADAVKAATDEATKKAAEDALAAAKAVADQEAAKIADAQKIADEADIAAAAAQADAASKGAAPLTEAAALSAIVPIIVESARAEPEGTRITALPAPVVQPNVEVVKIINNSTIININNVYIVETPDAPRLIQADDDVIVEQLPRGRTRETIVRPNGVQVVTIRNRFGDIIQRSRILPDGREVFLAYAPEYDSQEYVVYRDPGLDLPPLRLNVPIRDYILSVSLFDDGVDQEQVYYDFLEKPPIERVTRTYSVEEVKRSARVRDTVRRIDLDTITFGLGSADIKDNQIEKLQSVADAMLKLLDRNPAETFLIEGHTDAIGSDIANLALSDRRAASIANALTNAFGVPSENMTTQGYGERYLKVKTLKPNELNRRVAIRRITSLVAPVSAAK